MAIPAGAMIYDAAFACSVLLNILLTGYVYYSSFSFSSSSSGAVTPVKKIPPYSVYSNEAGHHSMHVNLAWNVGNWKGNLLKLPSGGQSPSTPRPKLIVDVGTEIGSGFMSLMHADPNLVLLAFEGHPINFGISYHNMLRQGIKLKPVWPGTEIIPFEFDHDRVLLIPSVLSDKDGYVDYNENYAPACGSILKSKPDGWWCTHTVNTISVPGARLDSYLAKVPVNYEFYYLKIDAEGADHLVVLGGGEYTSRFSMLSAECRASDDKAGSESRENNCDRDGLISLLRERGFKYSVCTGEDCHFAKTSGGLAQVVKLFKVRAFAHPLYNPGDHSFDLNFIRHVNVSTVLNIHKCT